MRRRLILPLFSTCALALVFVLPARADVDVLQAYAGVWRYADGREGVERVDAAVERAIDGHPFFLEPIARERVRSRTLPFRVLRFEVEGNRFVFHADDWGPISSPADGSAVAIRAPDGTPLRLVQEVSGGRVIQEFRHPDAVRRNALALSGDGQWLWMSVTVASRQLPGPCRFRLRYRRVPQIPTQHASR